MPAVEHDSYVLYPTRARIDAWDSVAFVNVRRREADLYLFTVLRYVGEH